MALFHFCKALRPALVGERRRHQRTERDIPASPQTGASSYFAGSRGPSAATRLRGIPKGQNPPNLESTPLRPMGGRHTAESQADSANEHELWTRGIRPNLGLTNSPSPAPAEPKWCGMRQVREERGSVASTAVRTAAGSAQYVRSR